VLGHGVFKSVSGIVWKEVVDLLLVPDPVQVARVVPGYLV